MERRLLTQLEPEPSKVEAALIEPDGVQLHLASTQLEGGVPVGGSAPSIGANGRTKDSAHNDAYLDYHDGASNVRAQMHKQMVKWNVQPSGSKNASVHKGSAAFKEGLLLPDNFESTERAPSESTVLDVIDTTSDAHAAATGALKQDPQSPVMKGTTAGIPVSCQPLGPLPMKTLLESGADLAEFRLRRCLGIGQFAAVHSAVRKDDGEEVAVKVWHRPIIKSASANAQPLDEEDVACYQQEVTLLRRMEEHSLVTKYIAHGTAEPSGLGTGIRGFIVLKMVHGQSLMRLLRTPTEVVTLPRVFSWISQIVEAVQHLHKQGILHRDLKESNIMIDSQDTPKIIDFGLSLRFRTKDAASVMTTYQAHMRVGVLGYMPLEVYVGKPFGFAVDIFGLGVLLSRCIARVFPPTQSQRLTKWVQATRFGMYPSGWTYKTFARPLISLDCPAQITQLIRRCCSDVASERPLIADVAAELVAAEPHFAETRLSFASKSRASKSRARP